MSKQKQRKHLIEQSVNKCPKCNRLMQRRKHLLLTNKILNQPFYFKEWDYCRACKHIQHYEEYKVWNNNEVSSYIKQIQDMNSLFKKL